MKTYRNEEGKTLPLVYFRILPGKSLAIFQLIFFPVVLTLSKNKDWTNGEKHGWKAETKARKETNL